MIEIKPIQCPKCGEMLDINNYVNQQVQLLSQAEKKKLENEFNNKLEEILNKEKEIELKKLKIEQDKQNFDLLIQEELQKKINDEKIKLEEHLRNKITEEKNYELISLKKDLEEKTKENAKLSLINNELQLMKIKLEQVEQEKELIRQKVELEKEQEFSERLNKEKENILELKEKEYKLKISELEKKLEDTTKLAEEMKRKSEQGSMQLQGEVQEKELEKIISQNWIYDKYEEIKKGQRGADLLHYVYDENNLFNNKVSGTIYYESKRTKKFERDWIEKLKQDNLTINADILVIATETMPYNTRTPFLYENGVWICQFNEIENLITVLRQALIQLSRLKSIQDNKETKMEILYNYLTSNEFKNQLESIITGMRELKQSYEDEKNKMMKIWKEREKQFERIISGAINFYGSLRGIAGNSIKEIPYLEENN